MNCGFNIKNTCGQKIYATCTYFEGVLPAFSTLVEAECYTLEEIVADIYLLLTDINEEIDVDTILTDSCLEYTLTEGKVTTAQAIRTLDLEVCALKDKFENISKYQLCDLPIKGCGLDLGDLESECGDEIQTFGDLIQALINKSSSS